MISTTGMPAQARTVLVVADQAETQTRILGHARAQGHSVISASTPALGLATFDKAQPDFVITDLFLPEQDGVMLVKQIRDRRPTCPVVLLTDADRVESTMEGLRAGAFDYVEQPIQEDAFAQVLKGVTYSLSASVMSETVVLDISEALKNAEGDQELFLASARRFLQESPKEIAAVRALLERQDRAGSIEIAHRLKESVMELCAPRLFVSVKRLEQLGRLGKFAEALPVCVDVETRLAEAHTVLRELIAGGFPTWWLLLVRLYRHVPCSS